MCLDECAGDFIDIGAIAAIFHPLVALRRIGGTNRSPVQGFQTHVHAAERIDSVLQRDNEVLCETIAVCHQGLVK